MKRHFQTSVLVIAVGISIVGSGAAVAQPGTVLSHQKISDTEGGFSGILDDGDWFGYAVASLGDLDGDGVGDLAVGARNDDDGGPQHGAVWVLFLNQDGTVKSHQKISDTEGGFTGTLDDDDWFGNTVTSLGDLDGDGVSDLAVGALLDDDGGNAHGAVWVLFLNTDGTVKSHQKISDTQGGFTGTLDTDDLFGTSVASLGDLDGDGVGDLAVGAPLDDDGGFNHGAVWVLFLNTDGSVKSHQKISNPEGGPEGDDDRFGRSVASLDDLDGDGLDDLAVGANLDDDGGNARGAVWVMLSGGAVQKINDTEGGFTGTLDNRDQFGVSVASLGDLDGDGVGDLAVGAIGDDDGGNAHGAVWVLFLNTEGTVKSHQKISDTEGGFSGTLDDRDDFGASLASLGDLDGDGVGDLAVGAIGDDDGGSGRGAVWVLFLDGVETGTPATLTDLTMIDGFIVSGGLPEMADSDDTYLETEAKVTGEAAETHRLLMRIRAMTAVQNPDTINITLEAHITDIEAIVTLFLRDFDTGLFEQVGQFTNGFGVDTTNTVNVPNASRFVRPNGRIVLRVKKIVILPFTLNGFHSLEDLLEIRVR